MCALSWARISSPGRQWVEDGDLVAHGAAGQEDRRLLAEERGHAVAERPDGGVAAVLLVADLGFRDRGAHRGCRPGLRVRIEVDADGRLRAGEARWAVVHGGLFLPGDAGEESSKPAAAPDGRLIAAGMADVSWAW